jgi:hypothetical protein
MIYIYSYICFEQVEAEMWPESIDVPLISEKMVSYPAYFTKVYRTEKMERNTSIIVQVDFGK